jgi:hypothetical protein
MTYSGCLYENRGYFLLNIVEKAAIPCIVNRYIQDYSLEVFTAIA